MTVVTPRVPRLRQLVSPLAVLETSRAPRLAATVGSAGAGTGWAGRQGSAASRGYDADWRRIRLQVLEAEPLCRSCAEQGRVTQAVEVHHLEGFTSLADPRRLATSNLAPICRPCHAQASQRQASGQG